MIFSQQISALEAYFADTLIRSVTENEKFLLRLLDMDLDIAKDKFSLTQIAAEREFVKIKTRSYLNSFVYHNIGKVRKLYIATFNIDLFELLSDDEKARLFQAIEHRHDCMHRNGQDKDGKRLDVFTKDYVGQISDLLKELVVKIEGELAKDHPWIIYF